MQVHIANVCTYICYIASTAKTAQYRGVHLNAKQYPPLYQFYVTADFRDYTARISADKRARWDTSWTASTQNTPAST